MKTQTIIAKVDESGEIDSRSMRSLRAAFRLFSGQDVKLTVGHRSRTIDQNSLLHAIFNDIATAMRVAGVKNKETGEPYSFETWREYFLDKYLPRRFIPVPKGKGVEQREVRISSTTLNTADFSQLITNIVTDEVLTSRGIFVQLPDEVQR